MMPFYGRFDHFRLAVESILTQTSTDWRLVIVDDEFPDPEPGRWARSIGDARVTYVRNDHNLGVSGNFRRCAELMTNEFGVLMGCDDIMLPRYVERIAELTERFPDASVMQPGVRVIDQHGEPSRPLADRIKSLYRPAARGPKRYAGQTLATSLLRANWAYFPSLVWRAETIREIGFRLDLEVVQDLAMLIEIIRRGGNLVLDDEIVFAYRRHAQSVSSAKGPDGSKFVEEREVFLDAADRMRAIGWPRAARAAQRHTISRLHALSELLATLGISDESGRRTLLQHIMGSDDRAAR